MITRQLGTDLISASPERVGRTLSVFENILSEQGRQNPNLKNFVSFASSLPINPIRTSQNTQPVSSTLDEPPTNNEWSSRDPAMAVFLPAAANRARGYKYNVLPTYKQKFAGICGGTYGLAKEFAYTLVDDTVSAFIGQYYQPWKNLKFDPKVGKKCKQIAKKLNINPKEIDLTNLELEKLFQNIAMGYAFEIENVIKKYFEKLGISEEFQWAYYTTLKRFELLSAFFEDPQNYDRYNPQLLKERIWGCFQQKNTLIRLLKFDNKKPGDIAYDTVEQTIKKCVLDLLDKHLIQDNVFTRCKGESQGVKRDKWK